MAADAVAPAGPPAAEAPAGRAPGARAGLGAPLALLAAALAGAMLAGVAAGATPIDPWDVWRILANRAWPDLYAPDWPLARERIVWELRAPRAVLGALAGAGLAMAGTALQATTRNALADPFLLGVSAGAALGAVAVITQTGDVLGVHTLPLAAFAGGLGSLALLVGALGRDGAGAPERVVLAGVAVSFILMAATNLLIFLGDQRAAHAVVFWMLGGLGRASWPVLWVPGLGVAVGGLWLMARARTLNALSMGDETAAALGVPVARTRIEILVVSALITSLLVALTGAIGFIGLVVPHLARAFVGGDNRRVLPVAALGGAILMVAVDVGARLVVAPQEAPVGVLTGAIGGAWFLWLTARGAAR
ncbi:FecCD family ABC transporter permease [Rubrimonas cliftonensis]|uniref:Iron complex transport system permease protein n=1 Tax=Rubrimonas cliftonensis TaxID=89524 RepID=A0A1H4EYQ9_9RHOB|nr:iron ABC transporter permease [Rubrimonas cliftonensis]SEA90111.1 iron complex transport system permease protein [Rubrimonas cliftonensis]